MIKNKPTVSIITPTYNRRHLLEKCYDSLRAQTCQNFEWIVIDDGSKDNTKDYINQVMNSWHPFEIIFIEKENGGKHTALNTAHPYIHGKYVLILDSDDMLTPDAVETVIIEWEKYVNDPQVGMVTFLKKNTKGEVCAYSPYEHVKLDVLRHKRVEVNSSDCCEVIRAELFCKYPFPVFESERFLAETALWYRAGLVSQCIYVNKAIYICEYLEGGLSKSGRAMRLRNPRGGMYTSLLRMHKRCYMSERIKAALLYVCYGLCVNLRVYELLVAAKPHYVLTLVCLVPGTIMYWIWSRKYLRG